MKENEDLSEVISDILIHLNDLELRMGINEERMRKMENRMDFLIKRMVKAENRFNELDKVYDDLQNFKQEQKDLNKKFIDYINKKPL